MSIRLAAPLALWLAACGATGHPIDGDPASMPSPPALDSSAQDPSAQGPSAQGPSAQAVPASVLMVGNSFTFWNGGLWRPLAAALGAAGEAATVEPCVQGGASLEVHWKREEVLSRVDAGEAEVVVLQGDVPEASVASFEAHAGLLVERVRAAGGRPVLFMTWDYERLGWLSLDAIVDAHRGVALTHAVQVVPVGEAFGVARRERPDLDLLASDREHPSQAGSYLALVMLALSLGVEDVAAIEPPRRWRRLSPEDAAYLRGLGERVCAQEAARVRGLTRSRAFCPN